MAEQKARISVPPKGTRGSRMMEFVLGLMKPLRGRELARFRNATGPEQMRGFGNPVLVLTTVGARSAQQREAVVGGFPDGDNAWLIVASRGGSAHHPAWLLNLAANPDKVWAQVGNRKFKAEVEQLTGKEREEAYARVVKVSPSYAGYLTKTDREIPVLRITPAQR
jgi:deazaflavin-dependent oxidoreductase (nitroreductase family)